MNAGSTITLYGGMNMSGTRQGTYHTKQQCTIACAHKVDMIQVNGGDCSCA